MKRIFSVLIFLLLFNAYAISQNYRYVGIKSFPQLLNTNISCVALNNNSKTIFYCTQSGVFEFDGMRYKEIRFGLDYESLLNSRSVQRLYSYKNSNHLIALISNFGLAILNSSQKNSYFQILNIKGIDGQNKLLGVERFKDIYLVVTSTGLFSISIKWREQENLFEVSIIDSYRQVDPELFTKVDETSFAIFENNNTIIQFSISAAGKIDKTKILALPLSGNNLKEYFTLTHRGNIFNIGTNHGLLQIEIIGGKPILRRNYLTNQSVYSTLQQKTGKLTIAASNGLYELNETGDLTQVINNGTELNNDILSTVYNLFDDGNNTWLATQSGLAMYSNAETPYFTITNTSKENKPLNHVYHIGKNANGNIVLSTENGLFQYNKRLGLSTIIDSLTFFLNLIDPFGNLMVSSLNNTYVVKNGKLVLIDKIYPEFKYLSGLSYNDYEYIGGNQLLLSTENDQGIYLWNYKEKSVKRIENSLEIPISINQSNNLYKSGNRVFILTDSVFWEYKSNSLIKHKLQRSNKSYGVLFDMLKLGDFYYFSSYDNGLIKTDSSFNIKYIYDKSKGLSDNGVYRILSVGDSILILSTNNGINYINTVTNKIKILNKEDGLNTNVFEEFSSFKDGNIIYFGGNGGLTEIDVTKLNFKALQTNLRFTDCKIVDDKNIETSFELVIIKKLKIPNNISQTTISFQNVIFPYKSKNKYAYKILESHTNWISLGNQNFITLISQKPGTYHIQIRATNEDGIWSEPKELILIFLPKWYQTWWFKLLVFLTTTGIIYAFYRYRIKQIEKQHAIRKNIATDLHDDLGSTLNSVKVFTNLAISGVKQEESLQQVKDNLTEATMSLRDMIWVLDDSLDTVDELITRLKQFAIPVAGASNIEAIIKADTEVNNRQLTKEEKRNLFLICKEAINNSIKYAGASRIDVDITASGKKIQIVVADNGKGFNVDEVKKGYGLKNMQYRAGQIKYKVELVSSPSDGTQITILAS